MPYNHRELEQKWQKFWEENQTYLTPNPSPKREGNSEISINPPSLKEEGREDEVKPKKYILDMFPYPSGAGLHVGHPKGYTATDIISRHYHAQGYNVLHPMGWDAFGLPAENYAIKTGTHPAVTTAENIRTFLSQMKSLGFSYDWSRAVDTTDPEYYQWTQWIFLELFKRGLAYEQDLPINYCPSCKTGLANEEVLSDNSCDRCGTSVERRPIRQWVLRITEYADRLIDDLEGLDWPQGVKDMQRNWIGKSEGCEFELKKSDDPSKSIRVYTTRLDTVYGMTYAVMAPDHPHVAEFITDAEKLNCLTYIEGVKGKSDQDRTNDGKEKTGVFTGSYVINPYNGEPVPLWIADYVLGHYGTGAVMAVPAHDERDGEFARKYGLPIKAVIGPFLGSVVEGQKELREGFIDFNEWFRVYSEKNNGFIVDGVLYNSGEYNGLPSSEARQALVEKAEREGFGQKKVNYKLRDWLFSRQRYWGEPIPLIHISFEDYAKLPRVERIEDAKVGIASVIARNEAIQAPETLDRHAPLRSTRDDGPRESLVVDGKIFSDIYDGINGKIIIEPHLPLVLPEVEKYEPAGDGQSPLATVPDWVNVKIADNLSGKRETNTMPQWGGSCWYYLRFMDAKNQNALAGKEALDYWQNVDEYVGGAEHAVLHLLYARFWHKVLYDIGVVPTKEPFQKLVNQGMILAYAYERADGGLVAVDLVEEKDGKFFEKSTGKEVKQVVTKMSKSLKNVVNPNDIVAGHGADTLRLYEMSMGAFTDTAPWNPDAIIGVRRFLDKVYSAFTAEVKSEKGTVNSTENSGDSDMKKMKLLHKTVKKVGEDIVEYKFNTAISALMILLNEGVPTDPEFRDEWKEKFAIILHPFAPHMAEELWQIVKSENGKLKSNEIRHSEGSEGSASSGVDSSAEPQNDKNSSIYFAEWPLYDDFMLVDDEVTIAVQVNGKLRGTFTFLNGVAQEEVSEVVRADESIKKWIGEGEIIKEIFIPNKMLSIVVK